MEFRYFLSQGGVGAIRDGYLRGSVMNSGMATSGECDEFRYGYLRGEWDAFRYDYLRGEWDTFGYGYLRKECDELTTSGGSVMHSGMVTSGRV